MQNTERTPLSKREYYALRQLFGLVSVFQICGDDLRNRLRGLSGGWRDLRMMQSVSDKLLRTILDTIPLQKLNILSRELTNTVCEVNVRGPIGIHDESGTACVETAALERMMDRAMQVECFACEKLGKKARSCPMRKDILKLVPWDFPEIGKDSPCPYAQGSIDQILEEVENGTNKRESEHQTASETV